MAPPHPTLHFGHVKGFAEIAEVPLAPITLLFGWNSAGKSTVLQSLLLLKQTIEEGDPSRPSLVVNGSLTQLGSFRNLVHRHQAKRVIQLGIEHPGRAGSAHEHSARFGIPAAVTLRAEQRGAESAIAGGAWALRYGSRICTVPFSLGTATMDDESGRRALPRVTVQHEQGTKAQVRDLLIYLRDQGLGDPDWRALMLDVSRFQNRAPNGLAELTDSEIGEAVSALRFDRLPLARRLDRVEGLTFAPDILAFADREAPGRERTASSAERSVAQVLAMALTRADSLTRRMLANIVYLGPFRQPPERLVLLTGEQFADVGTAGQNTIALLARAPWLRNQVDGWLERLQIPYRLAVDPLETTKDMLGDVLVAGLREAGTDTAVGMRDVGFGVSQVLPVVVQAVTGRGTTLAIEQPELHIHPKLQAQLGDLFAELSLKGGRFLLETHSEHLILRLLSWVRSGRMPAQNLAVMYVDRDASHNSVVRQLRVDEDGEFLDRWPHGFFTERRAELT